MKKRILSGIQPSGRLHVGNWFGAIRQHVALQEEGHDCFYFVANFHALTSTQDRAKLEASTLHVAMAYMALGIDPTRSTLFLQSDVPQVAELTWFLNCVCPMGLLERATSYKDKVAKGLMANVGLFDYPVLQAADIVAYDANLVPVGADQKQHLEITRDLVGKLNQVYGAPLLVEPAPFIVDAVAVVPGVDGQKMSKSYDNTIEIFETPKATSKRVMQIVTDSTPLEEPKDPARCNVYALLKLFATPDEAAEIADAYRRGGYGYGHAKKRLGERVNETFAPARERYAALEGRPDDVRDALREGGRKARIVAEATLQRVREAAGIVVNR
jgi:tryptophanyl-tRNA synthetase